MASYIKYFGFKFTSFINQVIFFKVSFGILKKRVSKKSKSVKQITPLETNLSKIRLPYFGLVPIICWIPKQNQDLLYPTFPVFRIYCLNYKLFYIEA